MSRLQRTVMELMKSRLSIRITALILSVSMLLPILTSCKQSDTAPDVDIDTETIADEITTELQTGVLDSVSEEAFAYQKLFEDYSLVYDTFNAAIILEDGTEVTGIGYSDYSAFYESDDGESGFFPAGFIADPGYVIPSDQAEKGLVVENLDYSNLQYQYVFAYDTDASMQHCVINGQYLKFGVGSDGTIVYEAQPYERGICDESLGSLYSYDESRYVLDLDVGNFVPVTGVSLFESIDYDQIEAEMNRVLAEQDLRFSEHEIITSVHIAQEAVVSYFLSMQEETFLGCNVSELVAVAEQIDPMECMRITPEGYVVIDVENASPEGPEAVAKWAVGISCGIVVIGSTALNIFVPAARPLSGAITGAAIDVFMQVVVNNQGVGEIQWNKVAVAAVSGAMMAWLCPLAASGVTGAATKAFNSQVLGKIAGYGVLTLTNGLVSGATGYANAKIDGEDGLNAFLVGAALGAGCTVAASALSEVLSSVAPKITEILAKTQPGKWLNKAAGKVGLFIGSHQVHLKNQTLEKILAPKSINEAAKRAIAEVNGQAGAAGGSYKSLSTSGDGSTQRHEMPSFQSTGDEKRANAPAIKMSTEDHRRTASYGSSRDAMQYRDTQAKLIEQGKYHEAIQMDIDDITSKFGAQYNDAIEKMLEYATQIGWW